MDIELAPKKLEAPDLQAIAKLAVEGGLDIGSALALLRHVQWQDDEIERLRVRLDPYLDRVHGSPAEQPVH